MSVWEREGERGVLRECENMSYAHVCVRVCSAFFSVRACVCLCVWMCVRPKSYTKYTKNKIPSQQQNTKRI